MGKANAVFTILGTYPQDRSRAVYVEWVEHGMRILSQTDTTRLARTFYGVAIDSEAFSVGVVLPHWGAYDSFARWFKRYGERLQRPNSRVGAMSVVVPSRGFARVGLPTGPIPFGDQVTNRAYRMPLSFEGTTDVFQSASGASVFKHARRGSDVSRYFYPAGEQAASKPTSSEGPYTVPTEEEFRQISEQTGIPTGYLRKMI